MKVEVAVLGSPSLIVPYGLCGRKAILNERKTVRAQSCVKVEVAALGSPSLTVLYGLCDREATLSERLHWQSSGAV